LLIDPEHEGEPYYPLRDELALFRTLADTEVSQEGVAGFFRRYGMLSSSASLLGPSGSRRPQPARYGEPLSLWYDEIGAMRSALELWGAKPPKLRKWIRVEPSRVLLDRWEDAREVATIASEDRRPTLWGQIANPKLGKVRRLQLAALFHIQETTNKRLREHAGPRLLFNPKAGQVELHLLPQNLLGAMWLQFARAVEGDKEYRRCVTCGGWFEVSPEGMRPEAKHCRTACRMRAYRKRKKKQATKKRTRRGRRTKGGG